MRQYEKACIEIPRQIIIVFHTYNTETRIISLINHELNYGLHNASIYVYIPSYYGNVAFLLK